MHVRVSVFFMLLFIDNNFRLFSMLNKFLLTSVAVPAMAVMVREIFINEPELCLKLHEEHVEKIFEQVHKLKTIYGDEVEGLMGKKSGMKELLAILETTAQVGVQ